MGIKVVKEESVASVNVNRLAVSDLEWSGKLNRALDQGRAFALLLSMLESDVMERPKIVQDEVTPNSAADNLVSHYRNPPLVANESDWHHAKINSALFSTNPSDGLLFQSLHPQPLSLCNDAKKLDQEVVLNCDYYTQIGLKTQLPKTIATDATHLYDVLQQLDIPAEPHI